MTSNEQKSNTSKDGHKTKAPEPATPAASDNKTQKNQGTLPFTSVEWSILKTDIVKEEKNCPVCKAVNVHQKWSTVGVTSGDVYLHERCTECMAHVQHNLTKQNERTLCEFCIHVRTAQIHGQEIRKEYVTYCMDYLRSKDPKKRLKAPSKNLDFVQSVIGQTDFNFFVPSGTGAACHIANGEAPCDDPECTGVKHHFSIQSTRRVPQKDKTLTTYIPDVHFYTRCSTCGRVEQILASPDRLVSYSKVDKKATKAASSEKQASADQKGEKEKS